MKEKLNHDYSGLGEGSIKNVSLEDEIGMQIQEVRLIIEIWYVFILQRKKVTIKY